MAGDLNTYQYANASPLKFTDRLGLDANTVGIDVNIPFVGGADFGIVIYDGTYGGGLFGIAGLFDIGLYGTVMKPNGGIASGTFAISLGQTIGCRSNFEGVDGQTVIGIGPGGLNLSGVGDSKIGNEGFSVYLGPSIGYETMITATGSITIGDVVRGFTSLITGSNVPWHGNDGCTCQ